MKNAEEIKTVVKEKYGKIAIGEFNLVQASCCCSPAETDFSIMADNYSNKEGYVPEADLNLGCGVPTDYAGISHGDTVLDLGSGAGNDVFIARRLVGENGKVIGLDFTDEMLDKANRNNEKLGYKNIEFRKGDIENMPVEDNSVDVVISNCVLNLVPDKKKAFSEIFRVLKPDGHFCVSDIVQNGKLPGRLQSAAEMYVGCVAGALQKSDYLQVIVDAGFEQPKVVIEKNILLPDNVLLNFISQNELDVLKSNSNAIQSITVTAQKK